MLSSAITFLVVTLLAALLGFGSVGGTAASMTKILLIFFLVLFVVSLPRGQGRAAG